MALKRKKKLYSNNKLMSIVQFIVSIQVTQKSVENSMDFFFSFKRKMNEQMNEQVNVGSLPTLLSSKEILTTRKVKMADHSCSSCGKIKMNIND